MNKKFFVIAINEGNAVKIGLKKWWRLNVGPTNKITHALYFSLLADGWKSEVVGNEILLISPEAYNGAEEEVDEQIENHQNENFSNRSFELMSRLFTSFIESYNSLKEVGILRNQKDITGQLGEWVASVIFDANIAINGINQFWDLEDSFGNTYQVKSHAKALTTNAKWSRIEYQTDAPINFIVIVVFDPNYKLREIYKIPFQEALNHRTSGYVLNWSRVAQFRLENIEELKSQKGLEFL